jgi:hypothetical protein
MLIRAAKTRNKFWHNRFQLTEILSTSNGTYRDLLGWRTIRPTSFLTSLIHFRQQPGIVERLNSTVFLVKCAQYTAWRTIGTLFFFTPTKLGVSAISTGRWLFGFRGRLTALPWSSPYGNVLDPTSTSSRIPSCSRQLYETGRIIMRPAEWNHS